MSWMNNKMSIKKKKKEKKAQEFNAEKNN